MSVKIENKLSIWEYKEKQYPWYRIDKKVALFFRKIKWMWQRAEYGYCDKDLWNLDHSIGNYIASSVNELANRTHTYPYPLTSNEWNDILRLIAQDFYYGVNEDLLVNEFENHLVHRANHDDLSAAEKEIWNKWSKRETNNVNIMKEHLARGFSNLTEWFAYLWD